MTFNFRSVALTLLVLSVPVLAHENHGETPGASQSLFGGVVKPGASLHLELVNEPSGLKVYPLDEDANHKLTLVPAKDVKLEAVAFVPGGGKAKAKQKVEFALVDSDPANAHFLGKVDPKKLDKRSVHRYNLEIKATYKGKSSTIVFPVEPIR